MRVLMTTWDMPGHLNPLVPLGWALRACGHEVVVASNPGLTSAITSAGLPALPAGEDFDSYAVLREQLAKRGWTPRPPVNQLVPAPDNTERTRRRRLNGFRIAADSADAQADDAVEFARRWQPDLVVFEPAGFLGPLIAKLFDIPAVRHLWSIDFTAPLAEFEEDIIGSLAGRFDLERIGVNGDYTLSPAPERLQITDTVSYQPIQFVPYNGRSEIRPLPPPQRKRVAVTWGTSQSRLGFDHMILAPRVVQALAEHDIEVVVAVTEAQRELFGELPDNVVHFGPVPLHALLPSCSALVHQGGAGGMMTGLINGLPQLVISHMPDEVFHARHLEASGGGISLPGVDAEQKAIGEAISDLLSTKDYAVSAENMRDEMLGYPTPLTVVGQLENLVETGKFPSAATDLLTAGR